MPTRDTALVYPGMCLVEGTEASEGRGTTRPFEIAGAPDVDGNALAEALADLPGVIARPLVFTPMFQKHAKTACGGVQLHVTDRERFKPFATGLGLVLVARRQAPRRFAWRSPPYEFERRRLPIDILLGTDVVRRALERGRPLSQIERAWRPALARWRRRARASLLYR